MDFDISKTYVDPSWPASMECDAAYLCSGLNQHDTSSFNKLKTELHIMIIENRNVYKFKFAWFPIFPI